MLEVTSKTEWPQSSIKNNGTSLRKQILTFGRFRHPNPKFIDNDSAQWNFDSKMADAIITNFQDGVVESVNYIANHDEENASPHGRVVELIKTPDGIDAIIDVGDPKKLSEILTKTANGRSLSDGVSAGIDERFPNPSVDKADTFVDGPVLRHVASTPIPFMQGMADWDEVPADKFSFGHKDYEGNPLVPIEETDMDVEEILAALAKKTGIDIKELSTKLELDEDGKKKKTDDESELTKRLMSLIEGLESKEDDDDEDKKPKDKKDEDVFDAEAALALFNNSTKPILETLKEFANDMGEINTGMEKSKEAQLKIEASTAVKELSTAGKLAPTEVEDYTEMYLTNKPLFESMTKDLPVKINFSSEPDASNTDNPYGKELSAERVEEETKRYMSMADIVRGAPQKSDKISAGKE